MKAAIHLEFAPFESLSSQKILNIHTFQNRRDSAIPKLNTQSMGIEGKKLTDFPLYTDSNLVIDSPNIP